MKNQSQYQTQGVLAQSPEPEAHDKVLDNARSNWNLEMLVFKERGKPEDPEKNPRSREENQQQTQTTYDAGSGNRTRDTLVGGERSHHYAIPAPRM